MAAEDPPRMVLVKRYEKPALAHAHLKKLQREGRTSACVVPRTVWDVLDYL